MRHGTTSCDPVIIRALADGSITTDPDRGAVLRRGRTVYGNSNGKGYLRVGVYGRSCLVHRIVWIDANGPIPDGLEVNHKNSTRHDNRLRKPRATHPGRRTSSTGTQWQPPEPCPTE